MQFNNTITINEKFNKMMYIEKTKSENNCWIGLRCKNEWKSKISKLFHWITSWILSGFVIYSFDWRWTKLDIYCPQPQTSLSEFDISVSIYQQGEIVISFIQQLLKIKYPLYFTGNDKSTHSDENIKGVDTFDFILANLTKNHTQFGKVFSKLILALESNSDEYLKY